MMGRLGGILLMLLLATNGYAGGARASSPAALKAAYVYYFTKFVRWDSQGDQSQQDVLVCVLGGDAVLHQQFESVAGKRAKSGQMAVKLLPSTPQVEVLSGCQILFVAGDYHAPASLPLSLSALPGVLSVSDNHDFQGIIHFVIDNKKLGFEIDYSQAQLQGLSISSKLLRLATKVHE